jgi:lipoteichoic acid synthase
LSFVPTQFFTGSRYCSGRRRILYLIDALLAIVFIAGMIAKIIMMSPRATESIVLTTLHHDALVFGGAMLIYWLSIQVASARSNSPMAQASFLSLFIVCRVILLLIFGIYLIDVYVYHLFGTRLYASDFMLFRKELEGGFSLVQTTIQIVLKKPLWKVLLLGIGATLAVLSATFFLMRPHTSTRFASPILLLSSVAILVAHFVPEPPHLYSYANKIFYENVIERNRNFFMPTGYSDGFKAELMNSYQEKVICEVGEARRPNLILVISESLSAYQSQYFSGLRDFTPNLDALAREHTSIPNFFANGWTTQGGLISLLTSAYPIVREEAGFNEWGSPRLSDFGGTNETIPKFLREFGYRSDFFLAGDLSFMGQGAWLEAIGFDRIEGHESPEYSGQPRGPFKSVPDKALYDKGLAHVIALGGKQPFFLVLETLWTHTPFLARDNADDGEESVFRDADAQFRHLYDGLNKLGFFENGLLIITGDHRSMEPFSKPEIDRFGQSASARIPMVIMTGNREMPSIVEGDYSQKDLLPSVKALVSDQYCRSKFEGVFLGHKREPPECIIHAKGESRDLVYAKCGHEEGILELAGDRTRFVNGNVSDTRGVVTKVSFERLRKAHSDVQ